MHSVLWSLIPTVLSIFATPVHSLLSLKPRNETVNIGDAFRFVCIISRKLKSVLWYGKNVLVRESDRFRLSKTYTGNFSFEIYPVYESDHGQYFCQTNETETGEQIRSLYSTLTVLVPPKPPRILLGPNIVKIISFIPGIEIEINCVSEGGRPPSTVVWKSSVGEVPPASEVVAPFKDVFIVISTLKIKFERRHHDTILICSAQNEARKSLNSTFVLLELNSKDRNDSSELSLNDFVLGNHTFILVVSVIALIITFILIPFFILKLCRRVKKNPPSRLSADNKRGKKGFNLISSFFDFFHYKPQNPNQNTIPDAQCEFTNELGSGTERPSYINKKGAPSDNLFPEGVSDNSFSNTTTQKNRPFPQDKFDRLNLSSADLSDFDPLFKESDFDVLKPYGFSLSSLKDGFNSISNTLLKRHAAMCPLCSNDNLTYSTATSANIGSLPYQGSLHRKKPIENEVPLSTFRSLPRKKTFDV